MRGGLLFLFLAWVMPVSAAELPGPEPLANTACIECHQEANEAWRAGPHGSAQETGCVSCHGEIHDTTGTQARRSKACIACHGGEKGATAHSYKTSKHGVIAALEGKDWDWSQRQVEANYRAPTCAYCHMHDGEHGQLLSDDVLQTACSDCHSGRYIETLFDAGRRMLGFADLKIAEATAATNSDPAPEIVEMLEAMKSKTLKNLRLGIAHQSPDYQWWFGHAALDGELLRIKSALSRRARHLSRSDE